MIPPTVREELGFALVRGSESISVDLRREGHPLRSGDTAGLGSPKHPRSRRRMAMRAKPTVADANALDGWAAEADRASSSTAPATRRRRRLEDNVLSSCDFVIDGSTTGSNGTYVASDPDVDVYAADGVNAFVCNTTSLGFDRFSFWKSRMGSHADSQVVPDGKLPAARLPGHRSGKNPTSKCAVQLTPAPSASTSTASTAPPSGPGTPARTSARGWRSPRSPRSRPRPGRRRSRRAPPPGTG
jgi:hypothetical protein